MMPAMKNEGVSWGLILGGCGLMLLTGFCVLVAGVIWYVKKYPTASEELVEAPSEPAYPVVPAPPTAPGSPLPSSKTVKFEVTTVFGDVGVRAGTMCDARIDIRPRDQGYWCNTAVSCGGGLLYGGGTGGFFPCTVTDAPAAVTGADGETTSSDRDGVFVIDGATSRISISDDANGPRGAFAIEARIVNVM